jgi:hypothetical protein
MERSKAQIGHEVECTDRWEIPVELRGWIDRVIVPILVKEFLRAESLQKDGEHG